MTAPFQVSGGNYPLIQQPSPFAELAATIQGIQAQHQARLLQNLQRQQLMAGIQHLAAQTALTQGQTAMLPAERGRIQAQTGEAQALTRLHDTETETEQQKQRRTAESLHQYQMAVGPINAALTGGVDPTSERFRQIVARSMGSIDDEDARTKVLAEYHNVLTAHEAQSGAQKAGTEAQTGAEQAALRSGFNAQHPGLAGYAATPGGLTYKAAEDKLAAENARLGAGNNAMQQRMALGAGTLARIIPATDSLESAHGNAGQVPLTTDVGTAAVGRVFGPGAGARLQQRLMSAGSSNAQGRYQALRSQFMEAMAGFYPRASAPLMNVLADSYFAIPGESAANREAKRQDRQALLRTIQSVQAGRAPRSALDAQLGGRLPGQQGIELLNSRDANHPADGVDPREFLQP